MDLIVNNYYVLSIIDGTNSTILDFSFFHIIIPLMILTFIYFLMTRFFSFFSLIPTAIYQILIEYKLKFIFNLVKQQLGSIGFKYIILFFSIFFFVLLLNLLSLLPFGIALTSHLIVILYFSLSLCIGIFLEGNISLNTSFYIYFYLRVL